MYNHSSLCILCSWTTTHTATDMSPINRSRSCKREGQICRVTTNEIAAGIRMIWILGGDWVGASALSQCVSTVPVCQHWPSVSALTQCVSTEPVCQHWASVSALTQCVSTEPVCQHWASVSALSQCVSILLLSHMMFLTERSCCCFPDFQGSTTRWCNFWRYSVVHNNFIQYVGLITTLNIQVSALPTSGSIPRGLYYYGHKWEAVLVSLQMHENADFSSEGWFINKYLSCRDVQAYHLYCIMWSYDTNDDNLYVGNKVSQSI